MYIYVGTSNFFLLLKLLFNIYTRIYICVSFGSAAIPAV